VEVNARPALLVRGNRKRHYYERIAARAPAWWHAGIVSRAESSFRLTENEAVCAGPRYDAASGKVRIEGIKLPDGSARDEAEATGQRAVTGKRKSDPHDR